MHIGGRLRAKKDALFFWAAVTHKAPATIRLPTSAHPPFPFPPVSPPLCPPSVHPSSGSCLELATRRTADPVRPSHKGAQLVLLGLYMTATGRLGRAGCLGRAKASQLGVETGHLFAQRSHLVFETADVVVVLAGEGVIVAGDGVVVLVVRQLLLLVRVVGEVLRLRSRGGLLRCRQGGLDSSGLGSGNRAGDSSRALVRRRRACRDLDGCGEASGAGGLAARPGRGHAGPVLAAEGPC